ncbi:MAG: heavy metal translocating P-type ATPase [Deltaproteobacteria bacterium]|nr:heavy metal translocating P-type ATPase [Deltaproteobacteria bacterium]
MTQTAERPESETAGQVLATERMKIGGMSCSFCVNTIKTAVGRLAGVEEVGVSLAHEEALVRYHPEQTTPDQIRQTVSDIGYIVRDPSKVRTFEEEEAELRRERNKLLVAAAFSGTTFLLMLFGMWLGLILVPLMPWVMLTLALETMFVTGWYIKRMAWASLRRGILNQHVLLEFGAFAGLTGGLLGLFVSPAFPAPDFFAVATFITTYHILSGYASLLVRTRSGQAVRRLLDLQPDTARVVRDDGREEEVPIDEVRVGDRVRIRPGENVPVDGEVVEGASAVNEALVTGEPIPADKVPGDEVIGGSINQTGTLVVRVTKVGEESFLNQVARSIEEARALRPGLLQLVDRILHHYVRGVLAFAALAFAIWTIGPALFGGGPDPTRATFATLAVLVMGYPCALGMATPLAMIRGGGMATERGILMRSGEAFQVMQELRTIVLDKTGTITRGEPAVRDVVPAGGTDAAELLRVAAAAEASSEHPLARAIEEAAEERGIELAVVDDFRSHTGRGVEVHLEGRRVLVGKPGFLAEGAIAIEALAERREALESQGETVIGVARDGLLLGLIGIADTLKEDAAEAVARMKEAGLTPVMITGDNERTARAVAAEVGIDEVLAQVLPDEKAQRVRALQKSGQRVAMVGDGINDAPALTQADVGIAIGAGTDIAIESADVVIMGDRLGAVMDAYEIGKSSYSKTKQNLALAFAFNGIGVPLAVTGLVHPVWAMVAMVASVSTVLTNSFAGRLLRHATTRGEEAEHAGELDAPEEVAEEQEEVLRLQVRMHCAGCAEKIGSSLPQVEGVRSAVADAERGEVEVVHLAGQVSEGDIRDHLRELGFHVEGHATEGKVQAR